MAGATGEGTVDVLRALKATIAADKIAQNAVEEEEPWRP
jgi:GTP-binding protein